MKGESSAMAVIVVSCLFIGGCVALLVVSAFLDHRVYWRQPPAAPPPHPRRARPPAVLADEPELEGAEIIDFRRRRAG